MAEAPGWLPPLVTLATYGGEWEKYVEAIYAYFESDFVDSTPMFRDIRLVLKRHPYYQNKEATFWHVISEGKDEEERIPDLRRCERIRWIRAIIDHADDAAVKVWKNRRRGSNRICLWLQDQEFLVILAERREYVILWTAYTVTREHQKRKLEKEYKAYIKANAAP